VISELSLTLFTIASDIRYKISHYPDWISVMDQLDWCQTAITSALYGKVFGLKVNSLSYYFQVSEWLYGHEKARQQMPGRYSFPADA
jgi:hypothetical protein